MSQEDATEFKIEIGPAWNSGWEWRLKTANGRWPHRVGGVRMDEMRTRGRTATKWGARREGRRALKHIAHLQTAEKETIR